MKNLKVKQHQISKKLLRPRVRPISSPARISQLDKSGTDPGGVQRVRTPLLEPGRKKRGKEKKERKKCAT